MQFTLETVVDYKGRETKYFYNPNGQLIQTINPNGTIENLEYNSLYQTTKKEVITNNYRFFYTYEYDQIGNLTSEKKPDLKIENPIIESFLINKEITYTNGNKILTYNGESVSYDLNGNMTHEPLQNEMVDFQYDKFNQLVEVDDTKYFYNGEGTRTKQSWNNDKNYLEYVTNPLGSLGSVISTKNELGEMTLYVYGLGLISQEKKEPFDLSYSNYRVFIFDSRGSTIGLTNEFGNITDTFSYGPYGELEKRTGATKTIFLYVGKFGVEKDNNGLSYMRARYYNPDTQNFVNLDPIKDGLNWYGYVSGNPINFIDPTGYKEAESASVGGNISDMVPLTQWINNKSNSQLSNNIIWNAKTKTATATMSNKSQTKTQSFTVGENDSYLINGKLYVKVNVLNEQFSPIYDPSLIYTPVQDGIKLGLAAGTLTIVAKTVVAPLIGKTVETGTIVAAKVSTEITAIYLRANTLISNTAKGSVSFGNLSFGNLSKAGEYGIKPYSEMTKALKGSGLQAHHIVEQRFGLNINGSVAVTSAEHQIFTNFWRSLIPYGTDYSTLTTAQIWSHSQQVYSGYPAILEAVKNALFGG